MPLPQKRVRLRACRPGTCLAAELGTLRMSPPATQAGNFVPWGGRMARRIGYGRDSFCPGLGAQNRVRRAVRQWDRRRVDRPSRRARRRRIGYGSQGASGHRLFRERVLAIADGRELTERQMRLEESGRSKPRRSRYALVVPCHRQRRRIGYGLARSAAASQIWVRAESGTPCRSGACRNARRRIGYGRKGHRAQKRVRTQGSDNATGSCVPDSAGVDGRHRALATVW